jgi:hypothetical protein
MWVGGPAGKRKKKKKKKKKKLKQLLFHISIICGARFATTHVGLLLAAAREQGAKSI